MAGPMIDVPMTVKIVVTVNEGEGKDAISKKATAQAVEHQLRGIGSVRVESVEFDD